jgi:hypothetical protein
MKKYLHLFTFVAMLLCAMPCVAQKGIKGFGAHAHYASYYNSADGKMDNGFMTSLRFSFHLSDHYSIEPFVGGGLMFGHIIPLERFEVRPWVWERRQTVTMFSLGIENHIYPLKVSRLRPYINVGAAFVCDSNDFMSTDISKYNNGELYVAKHVSYMGRDYSGNGLTVRGGVGVTYKLNEYFIGLAEVDGVGYFFTHNATGGYEVGVGLIYTY